MTLLPLTGQVTALLVRNATLPEELPAGQLVQAEADEEAEYIPAEQGVQLDEETVAKLPVPQFCEHALEPVPDRVPLVHDEHATCPVEDW